MFGLQLTPCLFDSDFWDLRELKICIHKRAYTENYNILGNMIAFWLFDLRSV